MADNRPIVLPPSPRCERCGHQLCPLCDGPWCDDLTCIDVDGGCFDECEVDSEDYAVWREEIDKLIVPGRSVSVAEGPFLPARMR